MTWRDRATPVDSVSAPIAGWRTRAATIDDDEDRFPGEPGSQASADLPEGEGFSGFASRVGRDYVAPALNYVADKTERYSAAPGRAALGVLLDSGRGDLGDQLTSPHRALMAAGKQLFDEPSAAPTRKDLASKIGVTDDTPLSERMPWLFTDSPGVGQGVKLIKGGILDFSPAGAVGEVAGLLSDPLSYVPVERAVNVVKNAMRPVSRAGNRVANKVMFSVPGDVTDRYIANPNPIRNAKNLPDLGKQLADTTNNLSDEIRAGSAAAAKARGARGATIAKADILSHFDSRLSDPTLTRAERTTLKARRAAAARVGVRSRPKGARSRSKGARLTDNEVYREIRELDELADWDSALPSKGKALINNIRHDIRTTLGQHNPAFDAQQAAVAERMAVRNKIAARFGLVKGEGGNLAASDATASALKDIGRANKQDRAALLKDLESLGHKSPAADVQASLDKGVLSRGNTSGSRRTNAGGAVGAGVGSLIAGPLGATVGVPIGAAAGAATDSYAGRFARASMDAQAAVGRGVDFVARKTKYVPKAAAANTAVNRTQSEKVSHFIRMQQDPEYRRANQGNEEP